jgi:hypothetical protein
LLLSAHVAEESHHPESRPAPQTASKSFDRYKVERRQGILSQANVLDIAMFRMSKTTLKDKDVVFNKELAAVLAYQQFCNIPGTSRRKPALCQHDTTQMQ